jgi:hypothetical protein
MENFGWLTGHYLNHKTGDSLPYTWQKHLYSFLLQAECTWLITEFGSQQNLVHNKIQNKGRARDEHEMRCKCCNMSNYCDKIQVEKAKWNIDINFANYTFFAINFSFIVMEVLAGVQLNSINVRRGIWSLLVSSSTASMSDVRWSMLHPTEQHWGPCWCRLHPVQVWGCGSLLTQKNPEQ